MDLVDGDMKKTENYFIALTVIYGIIFLTLLFDNYVFTIGIGVVFIISLLPLGFGVSTLAFMNLGAMLIEEGNRKKAVMILLVSFVLSMAATILLINANIPDENRTLLDFMVIGVSLFFVVPSFISLVWVSVARMDEKRNRLLIIDGSSRTMMAYLIVVVSCISIYSATSLSPSMSSFTGFIVFYMTYTTAFIFSIIFFLNLSEYISNRYSSGISAFVFVIILICLSVLFFIHLFVAVPYAQFVIMVIGVLSLFIVSSLFALTWSFVRTLDETGRVYAGEGHEHGLSEEQSNMRAENATDVVISSFIDSTIVILFLSSIFAFSGIDLMTRVCFMDTACLTVFIIFIILLILSIFYEYSSITSGGGDSR